MCVVECAHFGGKLAVMHMCMCVSVYVYVWCVIYAVGCAHFGGRLRGNAYVYVCECVCMCGCTCVCVRCDMCGFVCTFWRESCSNAYVYTCECVCIYIIYARTNVCIYDM